MFKPNILSFTLLHSEWPKLYGVFAILSAIGLKSIHHFIRAIHQTPDNVVLGMIQS